jgi:single-strand DNA-binding protein
MTNYVELTGNLIGVPEIHVTTEGVEIIQWRLKVAREDAGNDSIPCVSRVAKVRKLVTRLKENKEIEIQGEVRSRFWRSGGVTQSRVEIDVIEASFVK